MRLIFNAALCAALACAPLSMARAQNVEDEAIPDEVAPAASAPAQPAPAEVAPAEVVPRVEAAPAAPPAANAGETVTITRGELDALRAQQAETQRQLEELRRIIQGGVPAAGQPATTPDAAPPATIDAPAAETPTTEPVSTATGNRNYLLLPDISLIVTSASRFSNDRRDEDRRRLNFGEGELGIQGFVYPNVKADAYLVAAPVEDEALNFEEGYLTFLGIRKNLNLIAGRKFAPFGRTGEQHPHSWLYARQLLPRANLISSEGLTGDGLLARYLLPTGKNFFANLDVGIWNAATGAGEVSTDSTTGSFNRLNPFGDGLPGGTSNAFTDRFYSARLWAGRAIGARGELEIGASHARGRSQVDDDQGNTLGTGRNILNGADLSYRLFGNNGKRLLLRTEYFRNTPQGAMPTVRASGYYGLANYRFDKRNDIGVLAERSGFPQAPGQSENALSLIYTRQFTEQFYGRIQGTRGNRPGGRYNEVYLELVWGLGPHTHNLE